MQSLFKQEVKKDVFKEEIHKLALVINELNGDKGKLQYKEFVKHSKYDEKKFKLLLIIKLMLLVQLMLRLFLIKLIV